MRLLEMLGPFTMALLGSLPFFDPHPTIHTTPAEALAWIAAQPDTSYLSAMRAQIAQYQAQEAETERRSAAATVAPLALFSRRAPVENRQNGRWTPSLSQANAAFSALAGYARDHPQCVGGFGIGVRGDDADRLVLFKCHVFNPAAYSIQVAGVAAQTGADIRADGPAVRSILLSGHCGVPPTWRMVWIEIYNGGACHFRAFYDPARKAIVGFDFDGMS